jgi:hypothetical protein
MCGVPAVRIRVGMAGEARVEGGAAVGEGDPVEHADRIRVHKRNVEKTLRIISSCDRLMDSI